ncbi:glycosyltransferase family A protein, partial [Klebsiella pneumoniae]|uniref:glycosyltransferase family A protein n=1 Tax=Klebsiella pneumoniae TaxID=573 RepID=UPI0037BE793C
YQRRLEGLEYEVLVVDNGSPVPLSVSAFNGLDGRFRMHRIDDAPSSPAYAANLGVSMTSGRYLGIILDGARMVTPGVVSRGVEALKMHPRGVVTTMAWHLGEEHQSLSVPKGYGPTVEDALLNGIQWPNDGYQLFEISALAGANPEGFLG